ncbi:MAG: class I adenylate-forming enzyme family protein, partial [Desulfomonilia bacterium]|nr:class I adenylate-forming enzyme family protein [Desulfomonilia bacterium]
MAEYVSGLFIDEIMMKYEKTPDFPIITIENGEGYGDEVVTYADIFLNGCKVSRALKKAGIGRGDRFGLVMRNHPEFIYTLAAASQIGAVVVPIDPRSKGSKLTYQIKDSNSKGIIFTNEFTPEVKESLAELPGVKVIGVSYKEGFETPRLDEYPSLNEILSGPEAGPPDDLNKDLKSPFEIIYTSGTTGDPKGVIIKA